MDGIVLLPVSAELVLFKATMADRLLSGFWFEPEFSSELGLQIFVPPTPWDAEEY